MMFSVSQFRTSFSQYGQVIFQILFLCALLPGDSLSYLVAFLAFGNTYISIFDTSEFLFNSMKIGRSPLFVFRGVTYYMADFAHVLFGRCFRIEFSNSPQIIGDISFFTLGQLCFPKVHCEVTNI